MIIADRSAGIRYGTDPVAQSIRGFISRGAHLESSPGPLPRTTADVDFVRRYPSRFGSLRERSWAARRLRTSAPSLAGTATAVAALVALFHR
jgi:hypothetical protein